MISPPARVRRREHQRSEWKSSRPTSRRDIKTGQTSLRLDVCVSQDTWGPVYSTAPFLGLFFNANRSLFLFFPCLSTHFFPLLWTKIDSRKTGRKRIGEARRAKSLKKIELWKMRNFLNFQDFEWKIGGFWIIIFSNFSTNFVVFFWFFSDFTVGALATDR